MAFQGEAWGHRSKLKAVLSLLVLVLDSCNRKMFSNGSFQESSCQCRRVDNSSLSTEAN